MMRRGFAISERWTGAIARLTDGPGRWIAIGLLALTMFPALAAQPAVAGRPGGSVSEVCAPGVLIAGHSDALDKTTHAGVPVGGLSSLVYDEDLGVYYALVDNQAGESARFYTLSISPPNHSGFAGPKIDEATTLTERIRRPFNETNFDGEAIAVTPSGTLLIGSETEPSIREFSRYGAMLRELPLPEKFLIAPVGQGQFNQSIEGVTMSPGGQYVYSANESPLLVDGEGQIRILRHDWLGFGRTSIGGEFYYQTEPGQSVGDILAISDTELIVLERTFVPEQGNTIRLFLTSIADATDVSAIASLDGAGIDPLPKRLLIDIVDCPPGDAVAKQPQPNPLLDNFEGLALGPAVEPGHRTLYLLSDDNFNPVQVTRMIALLIDEELLEFRSPARLRR